MLELGSTELNVAVYTKMQKLLHQGLAPVVEEGLRTAWGDGWLAELNARREGKPDPRNPRQKRKPIGTIPEKNGRPLWDISQLLHTIREQNRDLKGSYSGYWETVVAACRELTDFRNDISHFRPETLDVAASARRVVHYGELSSKLLRAFRRADEAEQVEALIEKLLKGSPRPGASEISAPPFSAVLQPSLSMGSAPLIAPEPTIKEHRSKRRKPLPSPGAGNVLFPLVGSGDEFGAEDESLGAIRATMYSHNALTQRSISIGMDRNSDAYYQIIDDVRADEEDHIKVNAKTRLRFDPTNFTGVSYGLAAAIADRSARYGLASAYKNRTIVATGTIAPKQCGKVEAIAGLSEKIEIVKRYLPEKTLFIIPRENLNSADQETRAALDSLCSKGIEWRAVDHIDELNNLLPSLEDIPTHLIEREEVEVRKAASLDAPGKLEQSAGASKEEVAIAAAARRLSMRFYASAGAVTGLIVLTVVAVLAHRLEADRPDPALIQASDERIGALSQADGAIASNELEPQQCSNLMRAADAINTFDRKRLSKDDMIALGKAKSCQAAFTESDTRLKSVVAADKASDRDKPQGMTRLVSAWKSLTDFDLARKLSNDVLGGIADAKFTAQSIDASNKRLAEFSTAYGLWDKDRLNGKTAEAIIAASNHLEKIDWERASSDTQRMLQEVPEIEKKLATSNARISRAILAISLLQGKDTPSNRLTVERAMSEISNFDMSRASPAQSQMLIYGRNLPRNLRWSDFTSALASYQKKPSVNPTLELTKAYNALLPTDRIEFFDRLQPVEKYVGQAVQLVTESDHRLNNLSSAYNTVLDSEKTNKGKAESYASLIAAAAAINEFDRARISGTQLEATQKANAVKNELAKSDQRIAAAVNWADIVLRFKGGAIPRTMMNNVISSRDALNALDKERLTSEQKKLLKDVCGVPVETAPGMLPAIGGYDCYQLGDFKPAPLPALRR